MQYSRFGRTDFMISAVGIGGLYANRVSNLPGLITEALDAGINTIDTASTYGLSEELFGEALVGCRDRFLVATKSIHRDFNVFCQTVYQSLRRLQMEYIDLYYLHDISTPADWKLVRDGGHYDFLKHRQKQGDIRWIGVSVHDLDTAELILSERDFDVIMLAYNLTEREPEVRIFDLAASLDLGVVVMKPFAGGVLTETRSQAYGLDIRAADALRFSLGHPVVHTVIPGISSLQELRTAVACGNQREILDMPTRDQLCQTAAFLGGVFCKGCGYCLPCPAGVDIPLLMQMHSRFRLYDQRNWQQVFQLRSDYEAASVSGDACVGCGECLKRCPYRLSIPDSLAELHQRLS